MDRFVVKETNPSATEEKQRYSRYRLLKRLITSDSIKRIESPNRVDFSLMPVDNYYTITAGSANRIDLISQEVYGTPYLWWAICMANNIKNPFFLSPGMTLRIPSYNYIMGSRGDVE